MNIDRILLLTTTTCALGCDYCYMRLNSKKVMSEQVAKDAVKWGLDNSNQGRYSVEFFGGDPLCNLDIIKPTVKYTLEILKNYPHISHLWFTAFLNGYNENLVRFLDIIEPYKDVFHIQFSMDGCKEAQDLGRKTLSGGSSFEEVDKSIDVVRNRMGKIQIHSVISPFNCKYLNKSIDYIISKGCKNLEFGIEREDRWTEETLADLDREVKILADRYINWIRTGERITVSILVNPIHAITKGKLTGCYIGRSGLLIGHDGTIFPCQRMEKFGEKISMGSIYSGVKQESIDYWESVNCSNMPDCKECSLYGMCIGSCAGANYEVNGSPLKPIKNSCLVYKTIYRESLRVYEECKDEPLYKEYLRAMGVGWKGERT